MLKTNLPVSLRYISIVLRSPVLPVRSYSQGNSVDQVGNGGSNNVFSKREKAHEDMYIRQLEKEQLKRLRSNSKKQQERTVDSKENLENK